MNAHHASRVHRRNLIWFVVSALTLLTLPACSQPSSAPKPPTRTFYLALGDSLSAGYQTPSILTDRDCVQPKADANGNRGYVCLLLNRLRTTHPNLKLRSFGLAASPGEDSCSFQFETNCSGVSKRRDASRNDFPPFPINSRSQLQAALGFLRTQGTQVRVITLDLGGNDLAGVLAGGPSQSIAQLKAKLPGVLRRFAKNYNTIVSSLQKAAPKATIILISQYNPLSGVPVQLLGAHGAAIEKIAASILAQFAGVVKVSASRTRAVFADVRKPFYGQALKLTWILQRNIHPTAHGYRVYAAAVERALAHSGRRL